MIYLYVGEDDFRRGLEIAKLKDELIDPTWKDFNYIELKDPDPIKLYDLLAEMPFGMGKRLIVVNDLKALSKKADDDQIQMLLEAITEPADGVSVVFNSTKILGTIKFTKALKKFITENKNLGCKFEEFKAFQSWETDQAAKWLIDYAKEPLANSLGESDSKHAAIKIAFEAAEFMVDYVGSETRKLASELRRLDTMSGDGGITVDLIKKECKPRFDVFKLARELSLANNSIAIDEMNKVIESKEAHIGFLSGLQTNIAKYLKTKSLSKSRLPESEQAKMLAVSPGRLYHLKKDVQAMDFKRLAFINDKLTVIEKDIKQGKQKLDTALRLLVAQ